MPSIPMNGVFIPGSYLNTCNSPGQTGQADSVTGAGYPSGLTGGKVIELSDSEAAVLSNPNVPGQLFGGAYQWVKVDSGATAANVQSGRAAFIKLDLPGTGAGVEPESGYSKYLVTDQANADSNALFAGVFLNSVTPGNWGFIFVGAGRVNVQYRSALTNGAPAIGDNVGIFTSGAGLFDDIAAGTVAPTPLVFGQAVTAPAGGGTSAIYIRNLLYRI